MISYVRQEATVRAARIAFSEGDLPEENYLGMIPAGWEADYSTLPGRTEPALCLAKTRPDGTPVRVVLKHGDWLVIQDGELSRWPNHLFSRCHIRRVEDAEDGSDFNR